MAAQLRHPSFEEQGQLAPRPGNPRASLAGDNGALSFADDHRFESCALKVPPARAGLSPCVVPIHEAASGKLIASAIREKRSLPATAKTATFSLMIDLRENPTRSFSSSRLTDRLEWKVVPWSELARDADVYEASGKVRIGFFVANNPVNETDPEGLGSSGASGSKDPNCVAQCDAQLIACYQGAGTTALGAFGIGSGAQGLNRLGGIPLKRVTKPGAPLGSRTAPSTLRALTHLAGYRALGPSASFPAQLARYIGRLSIGAAGAIVAGTAIAALHAHCLAQYAGCLSGCQDDCK